MLHGTERWRWRQPLGLLPNDVDASAVAYRNALHGFRAVIATRGQADVEITRPGALQVALHIPAEFPVVSSGC